MWWDCAADADADGICDDVDDCVGELDECGICNGPGAIYECGCSDIPEGDCDCDGNQLDALACGRCALPMRTPMASVTMSTTAWANSTSVASATVLAPFTSVDVLTSQKETAAERQSARRLGRVWW